MDTIGKRLKWARERTEEGVLIRLQLAPFRDCPHCNVFMYQSWDGECVTHTCLRCGEKLKEIIKVPCKACQFNAHSCGPENLEMCDRGVD